MFSRNFHAFLMLSLHRSHLGHPGSETHRSQFCVWLIVYKPVSVCVCVLFVSFPSATRMNSLLLILQLPLLADTVPGQLSLSAHGRLVDLCGSFHSTQAPSFDFGANKARNSGFFRAGSTVLSSMLLLLLPFCPTP